MTPGSRIRHILPALFALAVLVSPLQLDAGESAVVYLVRHAERADFSRDPALSPAGKERADELAVMLRDAGIEHIYSTDFKRTRETAEPLSRKTGVAVELYDPACLEDLISKLKAPGERSLVVGHSNTTPQLVTRLGGPEEPDIDEGAEYDRLYVVTIDGQGEVTTVLLRFGKLYEP